MASISGLGLLGAQNTGATRQPVSDSITAGMGNIGETEFLKLLVAQLQNQDPLEPVKNEEFVAQLATFSSLEQLISINKAVTKLVDQQDTTKTDTSTIP